MEFAKFDRSGMEDDLSLHRINWNTRGAQVSGAMRVPSVTVPHGMNLTDMEFQIHCIETEAYSAVLRAFIAQSDVLSWGKEGLISELRKELRVSDVEHREILVKVDSDDSVRMIREWRKGTANHQGFISNASGSAGYTSHKKLKTAHITVSPSPRYLPSSQPSPAAIPSSLATHFREEQWRDDAALFPNQGNVGQAMKSVADGRQAFHVVKGRGSLIVKSRKGILPSDVDNVKNGSDWIEIRATNKLIHEVERVCGVQNPDPALVDKAKLILKDQERALLEALEKLADVSDGDDSPNRLRQRYSNEEPQINGHRTADRVICVQGHHERNYSARAGISCIDLRGEDGNEGFCCCLSWFFSCSLSTWTLFYFFPCTSSLVERTGLIWWNLWPIKIFSSNI